MTINMSRLVKVGFECAGKWLLAEPGLQLILNGVMAQEKNVLYAFAVDGSLVYVGKTAQSLQKRMQGYKSPASNGDRGGSTNIKNNRSIITALGAGHTVDIFVLRAQAPQWHGDFEVSLSAGLEDSLISALSPPWNGRMQTAALSIPSPVRKAAPDAEQMTNNSLTDPLIQAGTPANPAVQDTLMTPSAETLFAFAGRRQGETLLTLRRKTPFRVEVVGNFLEITPESSRATRRENRDTVAAVLARLSKTASFRMSDYKDLSFNASYVLAMVKCWQASERAPQPT